MTKKILIFFLLFFLFLGNICLAAEFSEIKDIYGYLIGAGAGLGLLAIIYGGIRFILSAGDPGSISEAKTWLISGVFGLIIIAAAGTIYKGITGEFPSFQAGEKLTPGELKKEDLAGVFFTISGTEVGPYTTSNSTFFLKRGTPIKIKNKVVNNLPETDYKFILFSEPGYMGDMQEGGSSATFNVGSIAILDIKDAERIGNVKFFQDTGYKGGIYIVGEGGEYGIEQFEGDFESLKGKEIDYEGVATEAGVPKKCPTVYVDELIKKDPWCLRSIKINGKYAVILWGKHIRTYYYQLFFESPEDITGYEIWHRTRPQKAKIIPYKTR